VGFLDRAKKLAEQAMGKAEDALNEVKARAGQGSQGSPSGGSSTGAPPAPKSTDPAFGTPYVPGMLGRPGWRERGLVDPAAILPIKDRDRVGVPHSTKSQILAEPFGVGRRWTSDGRSAGLFYQLDPDQQSWQPPGGMAPFAGVGGASAATLPDGRSLVFMGSGDRRVVFESSGLDDAARASLAQAVAQQLAS
jgi:hypothetical protein